MKKNFSVLLSCAALLGAGLLSTNSALAEVGMGLRAGTFGGGIDFDVSLTERLNARVAYNFLEYDREIEDTDATYEGTIKISSVSGYLDWHPFGGSFRLSLGAVGSGPTIDLDGTPSAGTTVEIGDTTYTAAQIGSLKGKMEFGNSVAPYIGIGWGNVVDKNHRIRFLLDIGAIYGGTPDVTLTATCGAALNGAQCTALQNQLRTDVAEEIQRLEEDSSEVQWWPVINIGLGIRF